MEPTDSVAPSDSTRTQQTTAVNGDVTITRQRTSVTDMVGIICLTAFACLALVKDHEAAAMAAIMVIPGIVGVRSALNTAARAASNATTPPMSAIVVLSGSVIMGLARLMGRA